MKRLFPPKKKNPTLESMKALSAQIMAISEARASYARGLRSFGERLNQLVSSVVPAESDKFKTLSELYIEAASVSEELAASENRTSEDVRDLVERFSVVTRCNNEYQKQDDTYDDKSNAMIDAMATEIAEQKKPTYEKVRFKVEEKVASAKTAKKLALMSLKEKLAKVIEEKEKYNKFKVRRLQHAWTTFANDHARLYAKEQNVMERIVQFLNNGELPTGIVAEAVALAAAVPDDPIPVEEAAPADE